MRKKDNSKSRLSGSDIKEFEIHVKHNMKRAYFTALGFVGSHDTAIDLSQEAFIKAYKHFGKFDKSKKFFTWYYKILKNLCLNFIRDSKISKKETILESAGTVISNDNPADAFESEELKVKVEEALFQLNDSDREIIILKEFQETSYKEISELLDIPIGTVMSKLYYARKRLAERLKGRI